jgi:hypothetical protein
MTRDRMDTLIANNNGVGAVVTLHNGNCIYYFYEDFDGVGDGINRAMNQLYPKVQNGIYKSVQFVVGGAAHE